jgi:hypothetical protein
MKAGRNTNNSIEFNFNNFYELNESLKRQQFKYLLYNMRFTNSNIPTLDQIDNDIGHTLQNVQFACLPCNRLKSNKDEDITRVRIQLKNSALFHNLPTTITNADTIRH